MPPPKNADHALVSARLGSVVEAFREMANSDATILEAGNRGVDFLTVEGLKEGTALMKLTDPELMKRGWTRRELKVAMAATLPKSELPWLLLAAQERHIARSKTLPTEGGGEKARMIIIPRSEAPVDLDDEDDVS